jgi:hypothetical protein
MTSALVPGMRFITNGFFSGDLHARLFWREMASNVFLAADDGGKSIRVSATAPAQPSTPGALPPWDVVVDSEAALKQQIAAHSNDARSWRVGLASGDYGTLNLAEIRSVSGAPVIVGSSNYGSIGARVTDVNLSNSTRLHLEFMDIDRAGQGTTSAVVDGRGSHDCGISWSRIRGGTWESRTRNADPYRAHDGVLVDSTSLRSPARFHVRHCAIGGHLAKGVRYVRGTGPFEIVGCVFFDMGGDDMFCGGLGSPDGSSPAFIVENNWGNRRRRIYDPGDGKHDHTDFFQCYAGAATNIVRRYRIRGNVYLGDVVFQREFSPMQGICMFDNPATEMEIEQNIISTQSIHAITVSRDGSANNLVRHNTAIRVIDGVQNDQRDALIRVAGVSGSSGWNVECTWQTGDWVSGPNSLRMPRGTAQQRWYGGPGRLMRADPFIHYAPVSGQITHWDHGQPCGAAVRFREVLVEGKHPGNQPGPVAAAWRQQYDPQNQITS